MTKHDNVSIFVKSQKHHQLFNMEPRDTSASKKDLMIQNSLMIKVAFGNDDCDDPKVYNHTSISDGLVNFHLRSPFAFVLIIVSLEPTSRIWS